ncbi:MAG TPA: MBL fold metallo-hydrolase [Polyangiales bacterium]|nr:MBL fold metallo-hydrolase [Polyangiales bacterium]
MLVLCACSQPPAARPAATTLIPYTAPSPRATLTYLGVAGFSLQSEGHTMLFDPYVTRSEVQDDDMTLVPDGQVIERYVPARADVIVVSHSHFDHVLDVPEIAHRTGAVIFGTRSTAELARASHVPEQQIVSAEGGEELIFKAFRVRAVEALHSLTGQSNLPIAPAPQLPLRVRDYQEGGTLQYWVRFAGHSLYFVGTANLIDERLLGIEADVAIVAVGLRDKVPDYTCRLLRALGLPELVIANHFDAWQEPLRPGLMQLSAETRADLAAFEAEVHVCAPDTRVITPEWLEPIAL